jgi:hypothetical protein
MGPEGVFREIVFHQPPASRHGCLEVSVWEPPIGWGIPTVASPPGTEVPYARWIDSTCTEMDEFNRRPPEGAPIIDAAAAFGEVRFLAVDGGAIRPTGRWLGIEVELHFDPTDALAPVERLRFTRDDDYCPPNR